MGSGSEVKTAPPPGVTQPVTSLERGTVTTTGKQPAKSKRPDACHTIDYKRDEHGTWAICGFKFRAGPSGIPDHSNAHSREHCIKSGHRRCTRCAVIRKSEGDWG